MNILVVGAGTHREFGFRRLRDAGHWVGVMDDLAFIPVELVDWFHPIPVRSPQNAASIVARIGRPIDAVVCFSEWFLQAAIELAAILEVPGPRLDVMAARHKDAMRAAFEASGMRVPRNTTMTSAHEAARLDLDLPLVVKPVDYSSSSGVTLVSDWELLGPAVDVALSKSFRGAAIVEEYVDGEEFSVEGIVAGGEVHVVGVTRKFVTQPPHFVETGHVFPADVDSTTEVLLVDEARRAADAVGLEACAFHCEVKIASGRATVIEIAGRLPGGHIARLVYEATGVDLYAAELAAIIGGDVVPLLRPTAARAAGVRFLEAAAGSVIRWPSASALEGTELGDAVVDLKHLYPWYTEAPELDGAGRRLGYCIFVGDANIVARAYTQAALLAPGGA